MKQKNPARERRLFFIDQALYWRGYIKRKMITEAFSVSEDTAKGDLLEYREEHNLKLPSGGIYRVEEDFKPKISPHLPDPEYWLCRMAGFSTEHLPPVGAGHRRGPAALSNDPLVYVTPRIGRSEIEPKSLQQLIRAIESKSQLDVIYQSPHSPELQEFTFIPSAFTHDSFRWACRGWRDDYARWGEIVLDRVEDTKNMKSVANEGIGSDGDWETDFPIRLQPNPGLPQPHREAVLRQYNFFGEEQEALRKKHGIESREEIVVEVRKSQLVYFLKRYQLEEPCTQKAPHQAPLCLIDRKAITAALPPRMRIPPEDG